MQTSELSNAGPGIGSLSHKWWVLLAVGVGSFMTALDGSVVNTILPIISRTFGTDVATIEWVITVYLLVVSGLLLSLGRLGDMYGHKLMFVTGFFIFMCSSAVAGAAASAPALIAARGLQAVGGAMTLANGPPIITKTFPPTQRGQALGLAATLTYLGLTAGPSLGGWLTGLFGWRIIFYINVPVGLLAIALGLYFIPRDAGAEKREPFDLLGACVFIAGLVTLLLALNQGHAWGWGSTTILGLLTVAVTVLVGFVLIERRVTSPMLDLSLFRKRVFSAAALAAVLNYICLYSVLFLMPFYLIHGRGFSPAQAGLLLTAQPLIMAVAAPLSGTLSDRIGSRLPATVGMAIMSAGLFLLSRLGPDSSFQTIALSLAVVGLGTGIFVSPNNSALLGSAPRHRQGIAAAILATARNVGMVLGVGLAGAVFTTVLAAQGEALNSAASVFDATSLAFLVASGLALAGAAVSALRGDGR